MLVLIGSRAARKHGIPRIFPKDYDIIGEYNEVIDYAKRCGKIADCYPTSKGKKLFISIKRYDDQEMAIIEAEITWPGSIAADLFNLVAADSDTTSEEIDGFDFLIPSLNVLYMLKMSHRFLKNSPHFLKTMEDIHIMRQRGAVFVQEHAPFFSRRESATYDYSHPKLNVSKKDFFNGDGVQYVYDHDSIHESTKILEKPAYQFFKVPGEDVKCSKDLFWSLPEIVRISAVLEESYVLALERSQIPFGSIIKPKQSFDIALMKVCTSITSGWFRTYAWENYYKAQSLYSDMYEEKFWYDVNRGIVKLFKE